MVVSAEFMYIVVVMKIVFALSSTLVWALRCEPTYPKMRLDSHKTVTIGCQPVKMWGWLQSLGLPVARPGTLNASPHLDSSQTNDGTWQRLVQQHTVSILVLL